MAEGILLSGATGFLGTNVLEQLIHHTDSEIYVLTHIIKKSPIFYKLGMN